MSLNPQAIEQNEKIRTTNPHVFELLSEQGRSIYFPNRGILAQSADARGREINATIGTALEDNGDPMSLESIECQINLRGSDFFNYAPSSGRPDIRKKWQEMMIDKNPLLKGVSISLPVVTCALTHGLSMAGFLFVNPGDSIILPDLYWENYDLLFGVSCGAKVDLYPSFDGEGFNVQGLRHKLLGSAPGKKIVVLNFPNNPTGYTVTTDEAQQIRRVLLEAAEAGNRIVVFVDDAYFGLVFEDGILSESIFGLLANAHERILAVKFDGPTKEDYVWGFRVGFVTFGTALSSAAMYSALESKLSGAIRANISNASNLAQTMLINAYKSATYIREKEEKFEVLKRRYGKIRQILTSHPEYAGYFKPVPFNSGYFMCVQFEGVDTEALRQLLLTTYNTGVIAQGRVIRIAFSSIPYDMLEKLFNNLFLAAQELRRG
jgi:aspartate/methionine/tyrosine aminotransferase